MFFGESGKVARQIGCEPYEEIEDVYDRFCENKNNEEDDYE